MAKFKLSVIEHKTNKVLLKNIETRLIMEINALVEKGKEHNCYVVIENVIEEKRTSNSNKDALKAFLEEKTN